jgi:hypothetical protein
MRDGDRQPKIVESYEETCCMGSANNLAPRTGLRKEIWEGEKHGTAFICDGVYLL